MSTNVDVNKIYSLLEKIFIKAAKEHGSMRDVLKGNISECIERNKK